MDSNEVTFNSVEMLLNLKYSAQAAKVTLLLRKHHLRHEDCALS